MRPFDKALQPLRSTEIAVRLVSGVVVVVAAVPSGEKRKDAFPVDTLGQPTQYLKLMFEGVEDISRPVSPVEVSDQSDPAGPNRYVGPFLPRS